MKRFCAFGIGFLLMTLFSGCAGVCVMTEPEPIPSCAIEDYQAKALAERKPRHVMAFDYSGCVEDAVVSSSGLSGKTSISGVFCARKIIEREFGRAAKANFTLVAPGQKADGVVYVETEKLLVSKSWSRYSTDVVFDIEVFSMTPAGRQRIFRKKYRARDKSQERGCDEAVPRCVYACIQQVVKQFVDDLAICQGIANFIKNSE